MKFVNFLILIMIFLSLSSVVFATNCETVQLVDECIANSDCTMNDDVSLCINYVDDHEVSDYCSSLDFDECLAVAGCILSGDATTCFVANEDEIHVFEEYDPIGFRLDDNYFTFTINYICDNIYIDGVNIGNFEISYAGGPAMSYYEVLCVEGDILEAESNGEIVWSYDISDFKCSNNLNCYDTDNGNNKYVRGIISEGARSYEDKCSSDELTEFFCQNNDIEKEIINCEKGCEHGVCLYEFDCFDTDEGIDYYKYGELYKNNNLVGLDNCKNGLGGPKVVSGTHLWENFWDDNCVQQHEIVECINGCKDGACVNSDLIVDTTDDLVKIHSERVDLSYFPKMFIDDYKVVIRGEPLIESDIYLAIAIVANLKSNVRERVETGEASADEFNIFPNSQWSGWGSNNAKSENLIIIGGIGENTASNVLLGAADQLDYTLSEGEAMIKLFENSEYIQMVIWAYGTEELNKVEELFINWNEHNVYGTWIKINTETLEFEVLSDKLESEVGISSSVCNGCLRDSICIPFGTRINDKYCSLDKIFENQNINNELCNNNYECVSNICINSECIESNLLQKVIKWFRALFG